MDTPRSFYNRDFLLALCGFFFLFMAVSLFFLFPVVLQRFGPAQSRIGVIMGVYSVVAIAIRPLFGRLIDLRGGRRFAVWGIVVLILTTPLFHLVRDAGWLPLLLRALTGLGWGVSMTATIAMCSDLAPVDRLAKSMGVIGVAGLVANAIGPLLAEELLRRFGPGALYNASVLFLVAALALVLASREIGRPEEEGRRGCGRPGDEGPADRAVGPGRGHRGHARLPRGHPRSHDLLHRGLRQLGRDRAGRDVLPRLFAGGDPDAVPARRRFGPVWAEDGHPARGAHHRGQSLSHRPGARAAASRRHGVRRRDRAGADLPGVEHVHHRFPGTGEQGTGHQPVQFALRRRDGDRVAGLRLGLGRRGLPVDVPHRRGLAAGRDGRVHGQGAGDEGRRAANKGCA
ncbi:MAG: MFS transporter [Candidatus Moduliflexus flocculans]|nr:MFS transporter [Candidatus Moduliflexus flocculans]